MHDLTLVLGNKNYSSWSLRPWFFMKQNNVPFNEQMLWLDTPLTHSEMEAYQSNFKVPVLIDGDFQVWESIAIMEYVADKHALVDCWPVGIKDRALARVIAHEMHAGFGAIRAALPMNVRKRFENYPITAAVKQDVARITDLWKRCRRDYGQRGPWLFGDFSIADAMYAPVVMRLHGYDVSVDTVSSEYIDTVISNQHIQGWITAGRAETQVIAADEVDVT